MNDSASRPLAWLHVVPSVDARTGGPAESVLRTSLRLQELGHRVEILCLDPQVPADWPGPITHALGRGRGYGASSSALRWLEQNVKRFDIVGAHGLWQFPGWATRHVCRRADRPYFVLPHGMLDPWFQKGRPLKWLKKALYWLTVESRVLRDAAAVCYTCEEERRLARGSFRPYRAREQVIAFGTAPVLPPSPAAVSEFQAAHPALRNRAFLLFLGRQHPKKGLEDTLTAYQKWAQDQPQPPLLAIAGPASSPTYYDALRAHATRLGLTQIEPGGPPSPLTLPAVSWLPPLHGDKKAAVLHTCEAMVLFSHQENFGIALAETLSCHRPVLISNQVNIWREITAAGAGLADDDDVDGCLRTLRTWGRLDTSAREAMRERARHAFDSHFEINASVDSLTRTITPLVPLRHS